MARGDRAVAFVLPAGGRWGIWSVMKRLSVSALVWSLCGLLLGTGWGWWRGAATARTGAAGGAEGVAVPPLVSGSPVAAAATGGGAASGGRIGQLERIAAASRGELVVLTKELLAGGADFNLRQLLWERWVEVDPAGGYEALQAGEFPVDDQQQDVSHYLSAWAVTDPDAGVARALALPSDFNRSIALSGIASQLAAERPADFVRFLPQLKMGRDADEMLLRAVEVLASRDPAAARKLLETESADPRREKQDNYALASKIASGWGKVDPAAALDYFRKQKSAEVRSSGLAAIAKRVVRDNPELAATLLTESGKMYSIHEVARSLAKTNPEGALAWLAAHFPEEGRSYSAGIVKTYLPHEAAAAVEYMARHAGALFGEQGLDPSERDRWNVDDPQAALKAAAAVTDAGARADIQQVLLEVLARRAPEEALAAAVAMPGLEGKTGVVVRAAVQAWSRTDLTAASGWVAALPPGPDREHGIKGLIGVAAVVEPDSALRWAAELSVSDDRTGCISRILQLSAQTGEEQVETILESLALNPQEKAKIRKLVNLQNLPR